MLAKSYKTFENNFLDPNFFRPKISSDPNFFGAKIFQAQNVLQVKIFFGPKFVFAPKMLSDYGQDQLFEDMKYENEEEDASLD